MASIEVNIKVQPKCHLFNYVELEYDLSKVMFIATANNLSNSTTPEEERKNISAAFSTIADLFYADAKMLSYATLTAASAGLGADRTYKLLQNQKRKTKR